MAMNNGYMVYLLRILAAQGALASVYTNNVLNAIPFNKLCTSFVERF